MKKLIVILAIVLTSCTNSINVTNLAEDIKRNDIKPIVLDSSENKDANKTIEIIDFSINIFENIYEDKNILISPISITSALAMTANGTNNNTLLEIEEAFFVDIDGINEYLYAYMKYMPTSDKYKVSLANSIWLRDEKDFILGQEFLQTTKNYYDAEIYKVAFDAKTKDNINNWVDRETSGQIDKLLDDTPSKDTIMYIINALSFDAEWFLIYEDITIRKGSFTNNKGEIQFVDFMGSTETNYIELPNAIGFSKPYADNKYSFVALLPEGEMEDFIGSLEGEILVDAFKNRQEQEVSVFIPKFSFEYEERLSETLEKIGIKEAFDPSLADFSNMGDFGNTNLFISEVIHKTKIDVDEKGTKAGAVTAELLASSEYEEIKTVRLDRPFFFMIVDNEFGMPIFMGVLNDVE